MFEASELVHQNQILMTSLRVYLSWYASGDEHNRTEDQSTTHIRRYQRTYESGLRGGSCCDKPGQTDQYQSFKLTRDSKTPACPQRRSPFSLDIFRGVNFSCLDYRKNRGRTILMSSVSTKRHSVEQSFESPHKEQPRIEDFVDENGIRTIVEYALNDEGKKVKV